jgi:hypothetical protein
VHAHALGRQLIRQGALDSYDLASLRRATRSRDELRVPLLFGEHDAELSPQLGCQRLFQDDRQLARPGVDAAWDRPTHGGSQVHDGGIFAGAFGSDEDESRDGQRGLAHGSDRNGLLPHI